MLTQLTKALPPSRPEFIGPEERNDQSSSACARAAPDLILLLLHLLVSSPQVDLVARSDGASA